MTDNIIEFKTDIKKKYEKANANCDDGDYVAALSSLLYEFEKNPYDDEILCHIADIYTELGLYENAVTFWFRFLQAARKADLIDGYNGLGANFFFLGNDEMAGYYFNKQMECGDVGDCVYDDILDDYLSEFLGVEKDKAISVVEEEDEDEENYSAAVQANKDGDHIEAMLYANDVSKKSKYYDKARYEKAYALIKMGYDMIEAIKILESLFRKDPSNVDVFGLLVGYYLSIRDDRKIDALFKKFLTAEINDEDALMKKLTLLCDFEYFDEALRLSEEILRKNPENTNCSYLRGMLLYNKGDYPAAVSNLKKSYIYSLNPVALYYLRVAESAASGNKNVPDKLSLSYNVPSEEEDKRIEFIKNVFTGEKKISDYDSKYAMEVVDWSFFVGNQTSQVALALSLIRSGDEENIEKLKSFLINPAVSDDVKLRIVSMFCEYGVKGEIDVVYSNHFKSIEVISPDFAEGESILKKSFAYAFGRISAYADRETTELLEVGAKEFEAAMLSYGGFGGFNDIPAMACAIYFYSGIDIIKDKNSAYKFFDAKRNDVRELMAYSKGEKIEKKGKKNDD